MHNALGDYTYFDLNPNISFLLEIKDQGWLKMFKICFSSIWINRKVKNVEKTSFLNNHGYLYGVIKITALYLLVFWDPYDIRKYTKTLFKAFVTIMIKTNTKIFQNIIYWWILSILIEVLVFYLSLLSPADQLIRSLNTCLKA